MAEQLVIGSTYMASDVGPYLWHDFSADRCRVELGELRALGIADVRVHLAWDAFMPGPRQVSPARLRDFETLLRIVTELGMRLVPVLLVQTIGDAVMLPSFAIDHRARPGPCRVVRDGSVDIGAPRDVYRDPLMLEAEVCLVETLLDGFANHPAILAWDLGHDPATAVRPRRIRDMVLWATELSGRIRQRGDRCWLTLGAGDLLFARGVRPGELAPVVDALGLAVMPQRLRFGVGAAAADDLVFLAQLAQCLAGDVALHLHLGVAAAAEAASAGISRRDPGVLSDRDAARHAAAALEGLAAVGVAGIWSWPSHALRDRSGSSPPFDRMPSLLHAGLIGGEAPDRAAAWASAAAAETARAAASPWPATLSAAEYYRSLPESLADLFSEWRRGNTARAGIVS